jgi:steroid delta-isomerase-like uncharacterized protein
MENNNSKAEQNKNLIRKVVSEVWNTGNFDVIDEFVTGDFIIHSPRPEEDLKGPEQVKQFYTHLHKAFPDINFIINDQIAEGDKVVTHYTVSATHKGEFKGIPATGNKVNFKGVDIDKISDGKFVECWSNLDELGLLQQLGVIPSE